MTTIADRVRLVVQQHLDAAPEKITDQASIIGDLGADSLDTVEIIMAFEEEFDIEISDDVAENITTVGQAIKAVETRLADKRP